MQAAVAAVAALATVEVPVQLCAAKAAAPRRDGGSSCRRASSAAARCCGRAYVRCATRQQKGGRGVAGGRAAPRASLGEKENELFGVPIIDRFPSLYLSYKNRLYKTRL